MSRVKSDRRVAVSDSLRCHCRLISRVSTLTRSPTWNYEVVHLHGTVEVHDDPAWKQALVSDLTDHNELQVRDPERAEMWEVSDAPAEFIDAQLKAIVGVELKITSIEAKRKLSQNKAEPDRAGAIEGLYRSPRHDALDTSDLMEASDET